MIGFFKFDDTPSVGSPLVLAHAVLNDAIQGYFYVRDTDCKDISSVSKGSEFLGYMQDMRQKIPQNLAIFAAFSFWQSVIIALRRF